MYGFIYETTNLINGKKYIGQHKCTNKNKEDPTDTWYLGSGSALKEDFDLYGYENFSRSILKYCSSQEELDSEERKIISDRNAVNSPMYYNIAHGGGGSWFTDKGKKKMSESAKLKFKDPDKRSSYCHPHRVTEAVFAAAKRNAANRIGIPIEDPEVTRVRMTGPGNHRYGIPTSEETCSKISARLTGIKRDEHHKKATSEANLGMKFVNNGSVTRRVKGDELMKLLNDGWSLGQAKRKDVY